MRHLRAHVDGGSTTGMYELTEAIEIEINYKLESVETYFFIKTYDRIERPIGQRILIESDSEDVLYGQIGTYYCARDGLYKYIGSPVVRSSPSGLAAESILQSSTGSLVQLNVPTYADLVNSISRGLLEAATSTTLPFVSISVDQGENVREVLKKFAHCLNSLVYVDGRGRVQLIPMTTALEGSRKIPHPNIQYWSFGERERVAVNLVTIKGDHTNGSAHALKTETFLDEIQDPSLLLENLLTFHNSRLKTVQLTVPIENSYKIGNLYSLEGYRSTPIEDAVFQVIGKRLNENVYKDKVSGQQLFCRMLN